MKDMRGLIHSFFHLTFVPIVLGLSKNRYLRGLSDGLSYGSPFLIIGSFLLLLANLPLSDPKGLWYSASYANFIYMHKATLMHPFHVSMGIVSLLSAFGIGYAMAKNYNLSPILAGFLSVYAFLILSAQSGMITLGGEKDFWGVSVGSQISILDARYLDGKGLFTAIIASFIAIEIYRFMRNHKLTIRLPSTMPPAVLESFEALLPAAIVTLVFPLGDYCIHSFFVTAEPFPALIMKALQPLISIGDSYWAICLIILVWHLFWLCGLHGGIIMGTLTKPIFFNNLSENQQAFEMGKEIPHIITREFLNSYAWIGGAGATLGLAIALLLSKHKYLKLVGKLSLIPGIFNISETLMFGLPIALNPIFCLPFIFLPLLNFTIAYCISQTGLIGYMISMTAWTLPAPLMAFVASDFNLFALILPFFLITLSVILYFPFVKLYEKDLVKRGYPDDVAQP